MGLFLLISVIYSSSCCTAVAAQAEIIGHGGAVPAEHGFHDPDIAVVSMASARYSSSSCRSTRHDAVHGALDFGLGLVQILAADACLLKLGIEVQQLLGGGQMSSSGRCWPWPFWRAPSR